MALPVTTAVSAALLRFANVAGLVTDCNGVLHKHGRPLFCYADCDRKRTAAMVFMLSGLWCLGLHLRGGRLRLGWEGREQVSRRRGRWESVSDRCLRLS